MAQSFFVILIYWFAVHYTFPFSNIGWYCDRAAFRFEGSICWEGTPNCDQNHSKHKFKI